MMPNGNEKVLLGLVFVFLGVRKLVDFWPLMLIQSVNFLKSSPKFEQLPTGNKAEFAFIGRSNVGKSSLINCLCNRKNLAKTSGTPGKTQAINHFFVNNAWFLVDLPGYGFAKVSKSNRRAFGAMIETYLKMRKNLVCTFLLIDSRIPPQEKDLNMIEFLGEHGIPFCIILTKTDGIKQNEKAKNLSLLKNKMLEDWESLPPILETSAEKGRGMDEILAFISEHLANYKPV